MGALRLCPLLADSGRPTAPRGGRAANVRVRPIAVFGADPGLTVGQGDI